MSDFPVKAPLDLAVGDVWIALDFRDVGKSLSESLALRPACGTGDGSIHYPSLFCHAPGETFAGPGALSCHWQHQQNEAVYKRSSHYRYHPYV